MNCKNIGILCASLLLGVFIASGAAPASFGQEKPDYQASPEKQKAEPVEPQTKASEPAQVDQSAVSETEQSRSLPATASAFPVLGLGGLLSFGAAFVVRSIRQRLN